MRIYKCKNTQTPNLFYSIQPPRFNELANEIIEIFPLEKLSLYYQNGFVVKDIPQSENKGIKKKRSPRVNTTGLLCSQYIKKRNTLRKKAKLLKLVLPRAHSNTSTEKKGIHNSYFHFLR